MKNILHVIHGLNIGGAETYLYNSIRALHPKGFKFDVAIQNPKISNTKLEKLIKDCGGRVFVVPDFRHSPIKSAKVISELADKYDVVHFHYNSLINFLPLWLCRNLKTQIVVHSHNTSNNKGGKLGRVLHAIGRNIVGGSRYSKVACGPEAAEWMFGGKEVAIIPNAVVGEDYIGKKIPREILMPDIPVSINHLIGNVARFVDAKNHVFILKVFSEYVKRHPDTALILIGDGELQPQIKKIADDEQIPNVFFLGSIQDTSQYFQYFDVFFLPSKFEGLPFVMIESQAAGCPIITSDRVTRAVDVTGSVRYISLDAPLTEWMAEIDNAMSENDSRAISERFKESVFDMGHAVSEIAKIYNQTK